MSDLYTLQSDLFKALAHPVRLRILELLSQGEASVSQLTTVLAQRQPYISQQLMQLREAGLVRDRREGSTIYYILASPRVIRLLKEAQYLLAHSADDIFAQPEPFAPLGGNSHRPWTPEED